MASDSAELIAPLLAAFTTGGLLGLSGSLMQTVLRNPLAEPYMLGITGGAGLFITLATHVGLTALGALVLPASALLGALASLAVVTATAAFAARRKSALTDAVQLNAPGDIVILAGFVTASMTCSLQMLVLSYAADGTFAAVSKWLFGDLRHVSVPAWTAATAVLVAACALMTAKAKELDVLSLGADRAECLGLDTRSLTLVALGTASVATAFAVATSGAIGFVGLVVPHVARRVFGERNRRALLGSALVGGLALAVAELVGRELPGELSAGVVTALLGSPAFLTLLAFRRPQG